jgi:hypothetical protein
MIHLQAQRAVKNAFVENDLVKEIAGKQNAQHKNQQQAEIERSPVEFNRLLIGIGSTFHSWSSVE